VKSATCTFGRMTVVFYVPIRQHGGGTDTEKQPGHKANSGEENSPAAPAGNRARNNSITTQAVESHPADRGPRSTYSSGCV